MSMLTTASASRVVWLREIRYGYGAPGSQAKQGRAGRAEKYAALNAWKVKARVAVDTLLPCSTSRERRG